MVFLKKLLLCFLILLFSSCATSTTRKTLKWSFFVVGAGSLGGAVALSGGDFNSMTNDNGSAALLVTGGTLLMFSAVAFLLDID